MEVTPRLQLGRLAVQHLRAPAPVLGVGLKEQRGVAPVAHAHAGVPGIDADERKDRHCGESPPASACLAPEVGNEHRPTQGAWVQQPLSDSRAHEEEEVRGRDEGDDDKPQAEDGGGVPRAGAEAAGSHRGDGEVGGDDGQHADVREGAEHRERVVGVVPRLVPGQHEELGVVRVLEEVGEGPRELGVLVADRRVDVPEPRLGAPHVPGPQPGHGREGEQEAEDMTPPQAQHDLRAGEEEQGGEAGLLAEPRERCEQHEGCVSPPAQPGAPPEREPQVHEHRKGVERRGEGVGAPDDVDDVLDVDGVGCEGQCSQEGPGRGQAEAPQEPERRDGVGAVDHAAEQPHGLHLEPLVAVPPGELPLRREAQRDERPERLVGVVALWRVERRAPEVVA
mmetsp:Transcript_602/g.1730  ORF Transcript_602/g.1730 Transcript_602/m.1730 type:complete len:394 (-) Transcript_602:347-1528(-)